MKLESHVTAQKLSSQLQEAGIHLPTVHYWIKRARMRQNWKLVEGTDVIDLGEDLAVAMPIIKVAQAAMEGVSGWEIIPAPSATEIGNVLPMLVTRGQFEYWFGSERQTSEAGNTLWAGYYVTRDNERIFKFLYADTEADVRAKLLLYLKLVGLYPV